MKWFKYHWVIPSLLLASAIGATAGNAPLPSSAGDIPDELKLFQQPPVVITAARKPQKITEAPSTIDVITAEDIRRSGALTLAEVLERLPGIYTPTAHNGLDMLWIRGVGGRYNDNALLLVDGIPYRTLYYSNFPINEQIPLADIQKIEVVRGPGSALYGTNAFTGVINIITKNAIDIEANEAAVSVGSWSTQDYHVLAGTESEVGQITGLARYLESDGYRVGFDDEGNPTGERRNIDNRAYHLKLRYHNFDFSARYSKFNLRDFTQSLDEEEEGDDAIREHVLTQLGYRREFGRNMSLQVRTYFNVFNLDSSGTGFDPVLDAVSTNHSEIYGRIAGIDILSTVKFTERHTLLLGANYEYEYLDRAWIKKRDSPTDPFEFSKWASASGGPVPESIDNNNWAMYLEDELRFGENLMLTLGLRFDSFEASESRLSPRFSAIFLPDAKTGIKLRYGEAFRAPTYQELYKQTSDGEEEGNRNLKPQIIKTTELEVSRYITDDHRLAAILFHTDFKKFIKVIGDGDFENLNDREFYGIELELTGKMMKDLSYFANYTYTSGKEFDGTGIGGLPKHIGNIGLTYSGFRYVDIMPHVRLVSDRIRPRNYQGDVPTTNRRIHLGGFGTVNLTLTSKNLPGPFRVSLSVRNLLDETYYTPGEQTQDFDIRQPGRRVLVNVMMEF